MSITEKLTASKNALASLLTFANAKTGKADPDIGEAIRTLVDGYGGGGGGDSKIIRGTIVPQTSTGTEYFDCDIIPDIFIVYTFNWSETDRNYLVFAASVLGIFRAAFGRSASYAPDANVTNGFMEKNALPMSIVDGQLKVDSLHSNGRVLHENVEYQWIAITHQ